MTTALLAISLVLHAAFFATLAVVTIVDLRTLRIPNALVITLIALWAIRLLLAASLSELVAAPFEPTTPLSEPTALSPEFAALFLNCGQQPNLAQSLIGGLVLGGGSLAVALAFERITQRPSMGGGDIKLLFAVGLWLGVERGLACLFIACLVSLALAFILPRIGWRPPSDDEASRLETTRPDTTQPESTQPESATSHQGEPSDSNGREAFARSNSDAHPESFAASEFQATVPFGPAIAIGAAAAFFLQI